MQAANLRITKVALRPVVGIFEAAEFLITVTNDGPHPAPNVIVRDPVPAGLVFTDAQWSQGTIDVATSRWLVGALQPTQSATLRLTATVTAAGTVVNTAAIISSGVIEVDLSDNISSAIVITPEPIHAAVRRRRADADVFAVCDARRVRSPSPTPRPTEDRPTPATSSSPTWRCRRPA